MTKHLKGRRILIVEDEEFNYFLIKELLSEYGISTPWAKSGLEAISMLKKDSNYDLVLMDIKLPFLNGLETTKLIKRNFPKLIVVAQTAYAQPEERNACFEAGCSGYLCKPFTSKELIKVIEEALCLKISTPL